MIDHLFQKAMEDIGLTSDEIHDVLSLVGAVLKLGNLSFVPTTNMDGTEGCIISNDYGKKLKHFSRHNTILLGDDYQYKLITGSSLAPYRPLAVSSLVQARFQPDLT